MFTAFTLSSVVWIIPLQCVHGQYADLHGIILISLAVELCTVSLAVVQSDDGGTDHFSYVD